MLVELGNGFSPTEFIRAHFKAFHKNKRLRRLPLQHRKTESAEKEEINHFESQLIRNNTSLFALTQS